MALAKPLPKAPRGRRTPRTIIGPTTLENRLILDLTACIRQYGYTIQSVEETAGVAKGTIRGWLTRKGWGTPKLRTFCAVLETLGLQLVIEPIGDSE